MDERLQFVARRLAGEPMAELSHPCIKRVSIDKDQFRHHIEFNRATFCLRSH